MYKYIIKFENNADDYTSVSVFDSRHECAMAGADMVRRMKTAGKVCHYRIKQEVKK